MLRFVRKSAGQILGGSMKKLYLLAAGLVTLAPVAGQTQDDNALEEILVTAQRREQNLQEVPISVSAFSGEQLEQTNARGAVDYLAFTPNVSFTEDAQSGARGLGISIRGVNNLVSGENAFVNSVGNYLDEFSIASVPNGVANPMLIDMERVEVLRGPQGTYFGRNSLGGALNITTRAPTDEYEGEVALGVESYEDAGEMYNVTGIFNAPLSDSFRVRGVAFYEDSDGLVENIGPGTSDSGHEWLNLRVRATWDVSDSTSLGFTVIYADEDQGTDENVPSGFVDLDTIDTFGFQPGTAFDPGTGFWPGNQNKLSHDLDEKNQLETTVAIVNLAHEISDSLTFKAVAGIIDATQERLFDNDLIGNLDVLKRTNEYDGNSWSAEARLESTGDSVDWVIGALYAEDQQEQFNNVAVSSDPTATLVRDGVTYGFLPPFPEGLGLARNTKNFEVESLAVFADTTWHVTDSLDLIVGARYTNDDVLNERTSFGLAPGDDTGPPGFINVARPDSSGDTSFSDVSPRAGFRYAWSDDASIYATVSKGYKAGGTSTGNNTNTPNSDAFSVNFDEETLWNYEIGIKTEFADRRVRLNASLFFLDWDGLQVEAFRFLTPGDLSSNFEQTVNVDAEGTGGEIELLAMPWDNFTFGAAIGYLDTEITDEPACDNTSFGPTCIQITGGFDVTTIGLEIPKAPELTANAFGEYRWSIGSSEAWLRGEYVHRDSQYSDVEALTNLQTRGPSPNQGLVRVVGSDEFPYKVPSFDVANLRGGFEWEHTSITLYVQNVFDEEYYTGTQENFGLSGIRLRPHPRTFGAQVGYKF
jgi:iron complex outermembrane receptor protein